MQHKQIAPFVSVIIPAYNESVSINECLRSVLALDWPTERMEVLVVDNGSTDGTPSIAEKLLLPSGRGRILHKPDGTIASVRNYGWRHARGEVLAFLDGDSVVEKDWLSTGWGLLQSEADVSCVGFAAALPKVEDSWVERTWLPISSSGKHKGTKFVRWLSSFNLLVKASVFTKIGGFDESLETCEDADLGNRLSICSRLIFSDRCRVRHLGTAKSIRQFYIKEYWRGQSSIHSFLRNKKKSSEMLSVIVPAVYLFLALSWLVLLAIVLIVGNGGLFLIFISVLLICLPLLMALRAGMRSLIKITSTSALYFFYLIARGAAIVKSLR
jgi:glycosyltransferase involved in cell wall biosynthesis